MTGADADSDTTNATNATNAGNAMNADEVLDDLDLEAAIDEAAKLGVDSDDLDLEQVLDASGDDESGSEVRTFDFNRPHSISRQFEQNLQNIAENFAKTGSIVLTNVMRLTTTIEFRGVRLVPFGDYLEQMPNPTCAATVTLPPLKGVSVVHLDLGIGYVFLKKLMGGESTAEDSVREFTEIERGIFTSLIGRILTLLQQASSKLIEIDPQFQGIENNPNYLASLPLGDSLVCLQFLIKLDTVEGPLDIGIPLPGFGPVRHIFDPEEIQELRSAAELRHDRQRILETIQGTTSELVVRLGEVPTSLEAILNFKEGEIIKLPQPVAAPLIVEVEGKQVFLGEAGRVGQQRAIKLIQQLSEE